jgi:hypothetical protein
VQYTQLWFLFRVKFYVKVWPKELTIYQLIGHRSIMSGIEMSLHAKYSTIHSKLFAFDICPSYNVSPCLFVIHFIHDTIDMIFSVTLYLEVKSALPFYNHCISFIMWRMLLFYNAQTTNLTFAKKNMRYTIDNYSIKWFRIVMDTQYNLKCNYHIM